MRVGKHNRFVTLSQKPQTSGDSDGFMEALSPANWWCRIEPAAPGGSGDDRTTLHSVTMRFHPQVSTDTQLSYDDPVQGRTRLLLVLDVQNVGDANTEMRLLCEEVGP